MNETSFYTTFSLSIVSNNHTPHLHEKLFFLWNVSQKIYSSDTCEFEGFDYHLMFKHLILKEIDSALQI
jgi:hypothetical protein